MRSRYIMKVIRITNCIDEVILARFGDCVGENYFRRLSGCLPAAMLHIEVPNIFLILILFLILMLNGIARVVNWKQFLIFFIPGRQYVEIGLYQHSFLVKRFIYRRCSPKKLIVPCGVSSSFFGLFGGRKC